jgi:hypothetical protein
MRGRRTPLSHEAHETLVSIGPRIVFYEIDQERPGINELIEIARDSEQEWKNKL